MPVQSKLKDRALRNIRGHPQLAFMGLDDRATNRQAHPHAAGLRREQWIEYPLDILWADSCPLSATEINTPSRSYASDLTRSTLGSSLAAIESMALVIKLTSTCCS